jgi:hypothetical protein
LHDVRAVTHPDTKPKGATRPIARHTTTLAAVLPSHRHIVPCDSRQPLASQRWSPQAASEGVVLTMDEVAQRGCISTRLGHQVVPVNTTSAKRWPREPISSSDGLLGVHARDRELSPVRRPCRRARRCGEQPMKPTTTITTVPTAANLKNGRRSSRSSCPRCIRPRSFQVASCSWPDFLPFPSRASRA